MAVKYDIDRLIQARLMAGLNQSELAEAVGVHYSLISKIERGHRAGPRTIKKIAYELNVPMNEIVVREEGAA